MAGGWPSGHLIPGPLKLAALWTPTGGEGPSKDLISGLQAIQGNVGWGGGRGLGQDPLGWPYGSQGLGYRMLALLLDHRTLHHRS